MTTKRNTLDHIDSTKIAACAVSSSMLREQVAFHVEFSGDVAIDNNYRVTNYIVRSVPNNSQCKDCGSTDTYEVYSYLTRIYARCNACGWEHCNPAWYSKTTRALQYSIAHAYPTFQEKLTEEIAEEQNEKRVERNRRARLARR